MSKRAVKTTDDEPKAYYAVRNGITSGVYDTWAGAVNAGWYSQQGFGNAIKCSTEAEAWDFLKQEAFPTGRPAQVKSWIQKKPFLVRLMIFSLMTTILCIVSWNIVIYSEDTFGCRNINIATTLMCKSFKVVKDHVINNFENLLNIFFCQVIGSILVASTYVAGILD